MASPPSRVPCLRSLAYAGLPVEDRRAVRARHPCVVVEGSRATIGRAYRAARRRRAFNARAGNGFRAHASALCYRDEPRTKATLVACMLAHLFVDEGRPVALVHVLALLAGTHTSPLVGVDRAGGAAPLTDDAHAIQRTGVSRAAVKRVLQALPRELLARMWRSWLNHFRASD